MWFSLSLVWKLRHREVSSLLSITVEAQAWQALEGGGEDLDSPVLPSWAPGSSLGGCLPRAGPHREWASGCQALLGGQDLGKPRPGRVHSASARPSAPSTQLGFSFSEKVGWQGRGRARGE